MFHARMKSVVILASVALMLVAMAPTPAPSQGGGSPVPTPAPSQGGGSPVPTPAPSQGGGSPSPTPAPSQGGGSPSSNLRFAHLTTDDGLSQNGISGILQDRQGYMWFATHDGLNRYDGNTFVVYKNIPSDSQSLGANFVHYLLEDGKGYLWVATNSGGVSRFDPITERFTNYRHNPDNPNSLSDDSVRCIAKDGRGYLWFGTANYGVDKFDPTTETFTHYRNDSDGQPVGEINGILADSNGDIWFVSTNGLYHVNPQTGQIARPAATIAHNVAADYVTEDKDGNLWMLGWSPVVGLMKYDPRTEVLTDYPVDPAAVGIDKANLLDDGQNGFWVPSSLGLYHFDRQTGRFTYRFQHDETNPASLNDDRVVSVYKDRSGLLWVGTESGGLNLLNFQQQQFGAYQHHAADPNSLSPGRVTGIYQDPSGIVWAGLTPRGLDRFDPTTGQTTHYAAGSDSETMLGQGTDVNCIYKDSQGYIWVSGWDGGLVRFDEHSGQFKHYRNSPNDPNSLPSDDVISIYQDRSGNLWIGTTVGLSRFDPATEQFANYLPDPSNPTGETNSVRVIYQDRSGTLWLGTWGGVLSRFDDQTKTFVSYTPDSRDPHKLNGGSIYAINEDLAGSLWLGALDGLYRYNRADNTFTRYTESQGLPSSVVQGVLEDTAGKLWLSTRNGLSRFDPQTETFRNFDVSDGLQGNDFSEHAYAQGLNGELLFGGSNGFNAFIPENIKDNSYVPPVVVTKFQIFNKPVPIGADSVLKQSISKTDALTLPYSDNVFSFEFAALSYASSAKNQYAYKLDGFDKDWVYTDASRRSATYTNLSPGDYTFHVKASNNDGLWNDTGTSIKITITPPWWETLWFRILLALALILLVVAAYQIRVRSLRRRNRVLEGLVAVRTHDLAVAKEAAETANQAKTAFLANMSHELRSPLTAILGQSERLLRLPILTADVRSSLVVMLRSSSHLRNLVNQVLDLSKVEAGAVSLQEAPFDIGSLTSELDDMFGYAASTKNVRLATDIAADVPRAIKGDALKLRQVLINLLGNAVKFTPSGEIALRVRRAQSDAESGSAGDDSATARCCLLFSIEDTGVGIGKEELPRIFDTFTQAQAGRESREGTGLGLAISNTYVELMGGKLDIQSELNHGTKVTFELPFAIAALESSPAVEMPYQVTLAPGQREFHILVTDDDGTARDTFVEFLRSIGMIVSEATDGKEATEKASESPDLIFMDVRMPVMDGVEATRAIRSQDGPQPVIVAMTASVFMDQVPDILAAGCDDFLSKPFPLSKLVAIIESRLGAKFVRVETGRPPTASELSAAQELPAELRDELANAIDALEVEAIAAAIAKISDLDSGLGKTLAEYAREYRYGAILRLVRPPRADPAVNAPS
jgi:signal transduction histidine kinase/ligand-binding sensor domain-containing protein/CheY-like chemotaxis protein